MTTGQRVVVVTGGGAGIGAAIAEEIGRQGSFVVTVDPLVTLDGSEQLPPPEETTAGRIAAAGGAARASSVSVTDGDAVRTLFAELVDEFGRLDAVVNVAGISRPTSWTAGSEEDWRAVLEVHVDGYRNVLAAALPIMAAAGRGIVLGVTSGSGWRAGDAGAYGMAKRAVASLTWQIGRAAPSGVVINAMSPIAVTRMVTAALERAGRAAGNANAAGPLFGSMPEPADIGPIGAYLASDAFDWCSGEVIFTGGAEVAVVEPPRLLEVVRHDYLKVLAPVLEAATSAALVPAETTQMAGGGTNPRFAASFGEQAEPAERPTASVKSCAVFSDRPELDSAIAGALFGYGINGTPVTSVDDLAAIPDLDGVIVASAGRSSVAAAAEWERILAEHTDVVAGIHSDARWARAVADYAAQSGRAIRLVMLTDATTAGGRSRAQAFAQHARNARKATKDGVAAFAVSVETSVTGLVGVIAGHLLTSPDAEPLSGAELVMEAGWFGLRSHPRPSVNISFGGPDVPVWLDDVLRSAVAR